MVHRKEFEAMIILQQPQAGRIESMKVSEALEKAFALLGPNGECWRKGSFHRNGKRCIAGALMTSAYPLPFQPYWDAFEKFNGLSFCEISRWNDAEKRTWPEVKDAFEKAIALARQEESLDGK